MIARLHAEQQIDDIIDRQQARLVVHIGREFSRNLHNGRPAEVQVIVDGRNSNVALIALGYFGDHCRRSSIRICCRGVVNPRGPPSIL